MTGTVPFSASHPSQLSVQDELRMENRLLRARLEEILEHAHRNQNIMERHQKFELQIIGASHFRELITSVFSSLATTSELDVVNLILLDPRQELQQMLHDLRINLREFPHMLFVRSERELQTPSISTTKPVLGPYQRHLYEQFFRSYSKKPASVALIPLIRQGRLIGYLNLGSYSIDRFLPTMATDFIERLGSIIAICLENVINNERLTYIGFNDQYGHQGGDDVLCEVARRIKAELRLSDTLGRFGGEEFVVLLINANLQDAMLVAERIRRSIAEKMFPLSEAGHCNCTISIGLTTVSEKLNRGDEAIVAKEMICRADRALYDAKRSGRNMVRCE